MTAELVGGATILTPTVRGAARKWLFWIAVSASLLLIAIIVLATAGATGGGPPFSATNAAPTGSKALVEVLRQRGVEVSVPASLGAAETTLRRSADSTLFLYDPDGHLNSANLTSITKLAGHIVLLAPTSRALRSIAPQVTQAGEASKKPISADCSLPAAIAAGQVSASSSSYRIIDSTVGSIGCFAGSSKTFSLIDIRSASRHVTVVGTNVAFQNDHGALLGDAALALTLLGEHRSLVWYLPTIDDSTAGNLSLAELTPAWVGAVAALLFVAAFAAAFWRGRRLGPLVVENLPVTVRASETMEGRARLYQRGAARLHALDSLRIGAVSRLATLCGLPRTVTLDEVIAAVQAITGRDMSSVRSVLLSATPLTDRQLVQFSDALLELERAVTKNVRES